MVIADGPIVTIEGAKKSYGRREALRGVDLQLNRGELLGFLGPNGAGKTTLIRCLAGRSRLDAGMIRFELQDANGVETLAPRSAVGFVPQTLAIYDDLTVQQNLTVFGRLQGVVGRQLRERINAALIWAKLDDRVGQLAGTLSGGMQRRLNIACSVLHDPAVLLLDEPTVGVDPQSRERIYEMLAELRARGTSILLTTHQLDEAQYRCDRIAIVDQGVVVSVGTLDELILQTVGNDQQFHVRFQQPQANAPAPLSLVDGGESATCTIRSFDNEFADLMKTLSDAKLPVEQVSIQAPSLQQVFLHLTGRELRE